MLLLSTNQREGTLVYLNLLRNSRGSFGLLLVSIFLILGIKPVSAQRFSSSSLTINASLTAGTANPRTYYGARPSTSTPKFDAANLGSGLGGNSKFDAAAGAGTLTVTAVADAFSSAGTTITYSNFYYRVYLTTSTTKPEFIKVPLTLTSTSNTTSTPVTYGAATSIDLLSIPRVTGGGTYRVDIYYDGMWTDGVDSDILFDPSTSQAPPYSATFDVISPAVTPSGATTTWQSRSSSDWFLASNWTNGVPNAAANAIIPENTAGTNIVFPILNDLTKHYVVNNITLQGNTASGKAQLTIQNALLRVYGNIAQLTGGLVGAYTNNAGKTDSTQNSTIVLAGGNQYITGRLSVPDIIVAGSGIKSVLNTVLPTNTLVFRPKDAAQGVVLRSSATRTNEDGSVSYVLDTTGNAIINLASTGTISTINGDTETTSSYVLGILTALKPLVNGSTQTFGNIGLDLTPNHSASNVTVTRTIGDPLIGPTTPAPGATPVPIKRQYQIVGDDNSSSNSTASSANTIVFHYLASDFELNGITESNLALFRTNTGAAPYTSLVGTLNTNNHTVTRDAAPTFANYYLTLGDKTNPLPVSLTAFTATQVNQNAVLTWTTAVEQNNKGFEVQVSSDGTTFRKLEFVASQNPDSNKPLRYSYTDTENGKAGIRYYRLRQLDISGEESYSPVRAVSFGSSIATPTTLAAYPNPFVDKISFNLDATTVGNGVAHVQLVDMTGRLVREHNLTVQNASLSLGDLANLRNGLYVAKLTLPDGTTQTIRVQKQ